MNLQNFSQKVQDELGQLFTTRLPAREDSRAFGGMIESRIAEHWTSICHACDAEPMKRPGRRTIFDFACQHEGQVVGVDVKTKDLDSQKYSDGGICAIANLLRFLANVRGVFLIAEFGHQASAQEPGQRELVGIKVAPFIFLPEESYRIENLGTGQLRLNDSLAHVWEKIDWDRPLEEFYRLFLKKAVAHYERVGKVAHKRIEKINEFEENGFTKFGFGR